MTSPSVAAVLDGLAPPAEPVQAIAAAELEVRLEKARQWTRDSGAEALLVGPGASLAYFTGLSWGLSERLTALWLPVRGKPLLFCPAFEQGTVHAGLRLPLELRPWEEDQSPYAAIGAVMRDGGYTALLADPALPFEMVTKLQRDGGINAMEAGPVIKACRSRKSEAEIAIIRQAMAITLTVQKAVPEILHEGIAASDVAAFIDAAHRKLGAAGTSFCIVQFGRATAYPHGLPGDQTLRQDDLVLVDTGCWLHGYTSDLTRTYCFGKPQDEYRRIWDIEKEAQAAAFAAAGPGVNCDEVDSAARAVLVRHGLGPDYRLPGLPHRTGHGIGMAVHEEPYIVRGNKTPLETGMCFSDEPMIVVPDRFGIRLEDHILITADGPLWFTEPQPSIVCV